MKKNKQADIKKGDQLWLYSEIVKDHFLNPRNVLLDNPKKGEFDAEGTAGNPVCGDQMKFWIKIDPKTKKIKDCKWRSYGCASAIASTSMLSVMVTEKGGMSLKKALNIKPQEIAKRLGGLPALKFHCSVLGQTALKEAINNYFKKQKGKQ